MARSIAQGLVAAASWVYPEIASPCLPSKLAVGEQATSSVAAVRPKTLPPIQRRRSAAPVEVRVERQEPLAVVAGSASVLYLEGSVNVVGSSVRHLDVVLDERSSPAILYTRARGHLVEEPSRTGFSALVALEPRLGIAEYEIGIRVTFAGGSSSRVASGATLLVVPPSPIATSDVSPPPGSAPLIAICMATHEPKRELLERQLESIRRQSYERFVCLISDDASSSQKWADIQDVAARDHRFFPFRSSERVGFYRNFERCLRRVPAEARFVALADQDDSWHADKLAVLARSLDKTDALLAYCDMNIVSEDGSLLAPSYWVDRANNSTDLASLLLMNTVTGAASIFRRELLDDALPFPPELGRPYHDHWLACVALALGEITYVDRRLQDYVQHAGNVRGSYVASSVFKSGLLRALLRLSVNPRKRTQNTLRNARRTFFEDVLRIEVFGRTLEARLSDRIGPSRRVGVRHLARLSSSYQSLGWLVGRSVRDLRGASPTLGAENQLAKGIVWRHLQALRLRSVRI